MPYIAVVLKNGIKIPVPNANEAEWVNESDSAGPGLHHNVIRLICKKGETILARFNQADVSGYVWMDGNAPLN